ncbi:MULTISPECIES: Flp pilus assembly protein CpaB [Maritimibacter]|jgi:pilus assembly protein CpaB|uniref:Flp pilus assembly protein CpaB n=1 Tax=Maritimibacter TaxID=404235 RepID=UPI0002DD681B|nr:MULTISPECIES: Flp pilus assembly protein CpaB [Maritimibacter]MBL6426343.1 Flp pilus assembly protein CpaB [Maritimibacter sp.]TYP83003.1 pilus assembly protein CpaB [Maritimibacter alkaliphilus HTCC2654]
MRAVFGLVLIVGVGLAGFAVYMARDYIGNYQAALEQERAARAQMVQTAEIYVVKESVAYGDRITDENIRLTRFPVDAIPEGAFKTEEELFPQGEKRYRTVLRAMEKDEALLAVKVTEAGADAGVAARLASGMRAFAIRVDVASGVSGFLRPGDKVDIYWTGRGSSDSVTSQEVTKLIQTNIRIIAIDQMADTDRTAPTVARTVTIEATPEQVAALAQAQATGRMALSLVGAQDDTVAEAVEIDQNTLLGIETAEVEAPVREKVCTIRTRKGAETVEVPVPCPTN